jgi:hypothetical protein
MDASCRFVDPHLCSHDCRNRMSYRWHRAILGYFVCVFTLALEGPFSLSRREMHGQIRAGAPQPHKGRRYHPQSPLAPQLQIIALLSFANNDKLMVHFAITRPGLSP